MARTLHLMDNSVAKGAAPMGTKCEVIGWLLVDDGKAQVLVRDAIGQVSQQVADPDSGFAQYAMQTGRYGRANPIIDPVTHETLGYEMERMTAVG
jgi:hypothetical protein